MRQALIRPATLGDAAAIARVHVVAWQESYAHIFEQAYLENLSFEERLSLREKLLAHASPQEIHLVAEDAGRVIGFCDAGPCRDSSCESRGEIYALYLLDSHKQQGIGTQLMSIAHGFLTQHALVPYVVWVLEQNMPARRFYEKMGGRSTITDVDVYAGKPHTILGYVIG